MRLTPQSARSSDTCWWQVEAARRRRHQYQPGQLGGAAGGRAAARQAARLHAVLRLPARLRPVAAPGPRHQRLLLYITACYFRGSNYR